MTATTTADGADFRTEVREWFAANTPRDWIQASQAMDDKEFLSFQKQWIATLADRGFSSPGIPVELGGGGLTIRQQIVLHEEWARAGAPDIDTFIVSLHHVPATLLSAGTEEQRQKYLQDAMRGTIWCQGFSEPDAGSDLSALRTRAEKVAGGWKITGQKIWSSNADIADYCLLLARTDPNETRAQGITYFLLDMHTEGVEVRPIVQNTGHHEFAEIFLDGAFIADEDVVGPVGDGWRVAQETLAAERGPAGFDILAKVRLFLDRLQALASPGDSEVRRLSERFVTVESLALDLVEALERGEDGFELTSAVKIAQSQLLQAATSYQTLCMGEAGLIDPKQRHARGWISGDPYIDWLRSWSWTIAGGTNEIQRNIIAERVLGMPREPRGATQKSGAVS